MRSSSCRKARSTELSILEVKASPRIVKHAKMYHLRGTWCFTECSMRFSNLGAGGSPQVLGLASFAKIGANWKREFRTVSLSLTRSLPTPQVLGQILGSGHTCACLPR